MKALVVGATGAIGRALVSDLEARGAEVVGLARHGDGGSLRGDVAQAELGLDAAQADAVRDGLTHVVACFGSVDLAAGPETALRVHQRGTRNLLDFAARCRALERFVHVSSILALGTAEGRVGNADFDVGQSFRNWYEYAKFAAEREVRERTDVPWRILRLGTILDGDADAPGRPPAGILLALPPLLRGYPVHLAEEGRFTCYPGDAATAATVVATAMEHPGERDCWTWFDPARPSLAATLAGLCGAWGVMPRIVEAPVLDRAIRAFGRRAGIPRQLADYTRPWLELDPGALDDLPGPPPRPRPGYIEAAGEALRRRSSELLHA